MVDYLRFPHHPTATLLTHAHYWQIAGNQAVAVETNWRAGLSIKPLGGCPNRAPIGVPASSCACCPKPLPVRFMTSRGALSSKRPQGPVPYGEICRDGLILEERPGSSNTQTG